VLDFPETQMKIIPVRSAARVYSVECGRGALARLRRAIAALGESSGVFIISSPQVWKGCGRRIERALAGAGAGRGRGGKFAHVLFDDRESAKGLATVEGISRELSRAGADRGAVLVAVGGGVVGDVVGFAAASYLRGVRLIHVPTTLVAQVDSAIGGKTGVNLPEGKNLVGAFYPPHRVVADPDLLASLPEQQFRSGLYEVIKYGILGDAKLFDYVEARIDALLRRDAAVLDWVVPRCIAAKAAIVSRDERESGEREALNLGHTLGHALESATAYRRYLHGEAVGWGIIFAALLAVATDRLKIADASRIARLVARVGPLPHLRGISVADLLVRMRGDKKSRAGQVRWVLPLRVGRLERGCQVTDALVRATFAELPQVFREAAAGGHIASDARRAR
jgi:3-dehydroquinate synthase